MSPHLLSSCVLLTLLTGCPAETAGPTDSGSPEPGTPDPAAAMSPPDAGEDTADTDSGPAGEHSLADASAKLVGEEAGDGASYGLAGAGDADGDGHADILVGAPNQGAGGSYAGAAYLVRGPISGPVSLADADAKLVGEGDRSAAGWSVAGVGDANADGMDDLLIGAPEICTVYLVLGPVSGTVGLGSADARLAVERDDGDCWFSGASVSAAGDVDGDGHADLLIGDDWSGSSDAVTQPGAAYLVPGPVSGAVDLSAADAQFIGEANYDAAGASVSTAGDVDGDGMADVLIGSLYAPPAGAAYLVYGPVVGDMNLADADAKLAAAVGGGGLTVNAVASAGDTDGDGHDDLLVGVMGDVPGGDPGSVYLVSGTVSGTMSLTDATATLVGSAEEGIGASVAGAGDVDGDGLGDVLLGAPTVSWTAGLARQTPPPDGADDPSAGSAYLVYGPASGTVDLSAADARFNGEEAQDYAGDTVAGLGDVDGDGRDDLAIGSDWQDAGGDNAGAAYLWLGAWKDDSTSTP